MNRRGFLRFIGAAAGVAAADPERLVWTPGRKLISIPRRKIGETIFVRRPQRFEGILTPEDFTRMVLNTLAKNLDMARFANREYDRLLAAECEADLA